MLPSLLGRNEFNLSVCLPAWCCAKAGNRMQTDTRGQTQPNHTLSLSYTYPPTHTHDTTQTLETSRENQPHLVSHSHESSRKQSRTDTRATAPIMTKISPRQTRTRTYGLSRAKPAAVRLTDRQTLAQRSVFVPPWQKGERISSSGNVRM